VLACFERLVGVRTYVLCDASASGGVGRHRGGDGLVRRVEFLVPMTAGACVVCARALTNHLSGILSERRSLAPRGYDGGGDALRGLNLVRADAIRVTG
jgi:5-oxoprolinase (ATP-hydrolysing)